MSATPHSADNQDFSDKAHAAARRQIYPVIFGARAEDIAYERTCVGGTERHRILDAELGIDYILEVACGFRHPLRFTVQERFREAKWRRMQDLTITEWNPRSGQLSELYKIASDLFVYGYYDAGEGQVDEAIVVKTASIKLALALGKLPFERAVNPRTGQPFVTLRFGDLKLHTDVVAHYRVEDEIRNGDAVWQDALPF
jgi:hypothetical protein